MKRGRKKRTRNDIAMAYRIDALPGPVPKTVVFETLIAFLDGEITELPKGWRVTWMWRNSRKSKLRHDSLENAVANSRSSFVTLMQRRLQRDLDKLRPARPGTKRRGKKRRKGGKKKRPRNVSKVRASKSRRRKPRRVR